MNPTLILQYFLFYSALTFSFVLLVIYLYFQFSFTYWRRKRFPYINPKFPLGNNNDVGLGAASYGIETLNWYRQLKKRGLKFGGAWNWSNPVLVITDPEYVKDILVKDFVYFTDRDFFHNPMDDPKNESLFVVEKDEWKYMRQHLSQTFTSAKMKMMCPGVVKCTEPLIDYINQCVTSGKDIDAKDIMAAYTIDVIGSNIFGLELGTFKAEDAKFREIGRELFRVNLTKGVQNMMMKISEGVARALGVKLIPVDITEAFSDLVKETIDYRMKNNVRRQDFMQMVIDLYTETKDSERRFTLNHLIANVIVFFIAGFDTSATTLHFALYELALHQDLQDKAREEINRVLSNHNGNLTYEAVQQMTYVKQILNETLRVYPPLNAVARVAVRPYKLKNTDLWLEKGTRVVIPVIGFQNDPEFVPEPERFDPERFSAENKNNIPPYVYLPFGDGPRICVGMRFALLQSTIGLAQILRNFRITSSPSMQTPINPKRGVFIMMPEERIFVKAEKI